MRRGLWGSQLLLKLAEIGLNTKTNLGKKKVYTVTGHEYNSLGNVAPGTSVSPVI